MTLVMRTKALFRRIAYEREAVIKEALGNEGL
jgi:hypothetical protein